MHNGICESWVVHNKIIFIKGWAEHGGLQELVSPSWVLGLTEIFNVFGMLIGSFGIRKIIFKLNNTAILFGDLYFLRVCLLDNNLESWTLLFFFL